MKIRKPIMAACIGQPSREGSLIEHSMRGESSVHEKLYEFRDESQQGMPIDKWESHAKLRARSAKFDPRVFGRYDKYSAQEAQQDNGAMRFFPFWAMRSRDNEEEAMRLHFDEVFDRLLREGYAQPVDGYPAIIELELKPTFGTVEAESSFILNVGRLCEANREQERKQALQRKGDVFTY